MNQLLAALVNGALLGALVTAAVWLVLRLVPRRVLNAPTRYILWWATLAIVIGLPALYQPVGQALSPVNPKPLTTTAPPNSRSIDLSHSQAALPVAQALILAAPAPVPPPGAQSLTPESRQPNRGPADDKKRSSAPLSRTIQIPDTRWPRLFFAVWLLAALSLLIRLAVSCALLDRTSRRAFDVPAPLRAKAQVWLAQCGATRHGVRLAGSSEIASPVAVGPRHPSILIPSELLDTLDARELQQIGLHEAAHLSRYDDYTLIVQRVLEAVLVLHPVVRWITRQIDLEREIACDDLVIAATGHPRSYAACLTRIVELSVGARSSLAAAGVADDTSHLSRRIDLLLDKTRQVSTQLLKTRLTAMIAAVAALGWIAGRVPGFVAFATPLVHSVRQAVPRLLLPPMMSRAVEEPQTGSPDFDGRVIEDFSGNPMASAELRFRKAGMRELAADLDTDREGRVRAIGLPAGDYTVEVAKPNYVTTSLKLHVPATGLVVRLVRYAAIGGQVLDQQGQPVPAFIHAPGGRTVGGTRIAILAKTKGTEELRQVRETVVEGSGYYRVHDLTPGEYAVGMWYDGLKDGSGVQLYPDNAHPRFFTVSGGEEINNIDFTILPRAVYRVSGKVELPKPGQQFALALGLPEQPAIPIAQALTEEDGSFRFEKVPIGTYELFVGGPSRGYGAHDTVLGPGPLFAHTQVQVSGQNVEGLTIAVSAGRSCAVVLRAHGAPPESSDPPAGCPQTASVSIVPMEPWGLMFQNTTEAAFGKEQSMQNLAPGRFRVEAVGLPSGCYQAVPTVVDFSREAAGPVPLELASAGSIRGVLRAGTAPAKDYSVVLLDADAGVGAQSQLAFPDSQGHFAFQGLHPGRYRIAGQAAADATRSRWISDVSRMLEIEVGGGAPTDVELPVAVKEVRQ